MYESIFAVNLDQIAVTRLFVSIKNKLDFDAQQDKLFQKRLLNSYEDEYVFCKLGRHYRCERLIKYIIRNRLCTQFVAFLEDTEIPGQKQLYHEIRNIQKKMITASTGKQMIVHTKKNVKKQNLFIILVVNFTDAVEERPSFEIAGDLLQRHLKLLYMELEPRDIADELFQEEYISIINHDDITFCRKKHKRFERLLYVLKNKKLYLVFCHTLQSKYPLVWNTMHSDEHQTCNPCK